MAENIRRSWGYFTSKSVELSNPTCNWFLGPPSRKGLNSLQLGENEGMSTLKRDHFKRKGESLPTIIF